MGFFFFFAVWVTLGWTSFLSYFVIIEHYLSFLEVFARMVLFGCVVGLLAAKAGLLNFCPLS